ncbi:MAG: DUF3105 domain-containing protein [Chloroflexi bacterium]|nr:DUF3105 domain-containing protein [Chloroflexota bacterium]
MARKISRREERARRRAQEQQRNRLLAIGGGILVLFLVGWWAYGQFAKPTLPADASPTGGPQEVPILGWEHVSPGSAPLYEYNSNPPTSGWHYSLPAEPGVYAEPVPDGNLIHSLEHGYVIISYNCASLSESECQDLRQKLTDIFNAEGAWKLIVVPRPELDTTIALTAWGWIDKFDDYDEARIRSFIARFRDQGPEDTPG